MRILCITPIRHLPGLYELMNEYGEVIYEPYIDKGYLTKKLSEDKTIDCIFTNPNKQTYKLDEQILQGSSIKVINTASTGLNHIDINACDKLGINVISLTNDRELINNLPSTSELAFGLMIALLRNIVPSFEHVKSHEWDYEKYIGRQIHGLTLGVIGFGRLGVMMANFGKAFGMNVVIYDPYKNSDEFKMVSLEELANISDVISLHVHVSDETKEIINSKIISKMNKKPIIINTSRGEIVNEQDVIKGLENDQLSGYGTDVLADEFGNIQNSEMIQKAKEGLNIMITPHIGGMTWEGQTLAYKHAIIKFKSL